MSAAPSWAQGFPLEQLRALAACLASTIKPCSYGAFGLPKERDIAAALAAGNLLWTRRPGSDQPEAAAILHRAKAGSKQQDFAQRSISILPGDISIRSIGGTRSGCSRLLEAAITRAAGGPLWLDLHPEAWQLEGLPQEHGFSLAATKVAASSDIHGIWLHGADPSRRISAQLSPADHAALRMIDPQFASPAEIQQALAEISAYSPSWEQHYSSYNKRKSWTAIALQGFVSSDPSFIIKPAEMSIGWKKENQQLLGASCRPTPALEAMPSLAAIADRIPGRKERIRLMRLRRGNGELSRHADITDRHAGTRDGMICRLHVPIITAPGCLFSGWQADGRQITKHFPAGSLFYLDVRKPHAVKNTSEVDRIHLVVDTHSSAELRGWLHG